MATAFQLEFLLSELPGSAKFKVDDIEYIYKIKYNSRADFVTLEISDEETGSVLFIRKLMIGVDTLLYSKRASSEDPDVKVNVEIDKSLLCFDDDGVEVNVTTENFYNPKVKLNYV